MGWSEASGRVSVRVTRADTFRTMGSSSRATGKTVELHLHDAEELWSVIGGRARVMTDGEDH